MQLPHRTSIRIAHVRAADACRVGRHGADLLAHLCLVFTQSDGVVVRLGHLLPVQSWHLGSGSEHGLRLGQDHLTATFEITEQTLAVAMIQILLLIEQCFG